MKHTILIVDDEPDIRKLLSMTLSRMDINSEAVANLHDARQAIQKHKHDLILTDMRLPDGEGIELIEYVRNQGLDTPIAVITAYGNVESAVNSLKAGAFDYVSKPVDINMLRTLVHTALSLDDVKSEKIKNDHLLIGQSQVMQTLRENIDKVARSQAPVFIHGASGVGKELVARLIHTNSPRSKEPFIPVNCAAIPFELMESEFFGHKKGSFTGAVADKQGLFQAAHCGSLFLDEIAELPLSMQVKLLRAIQEKAIKPVGAVEEIAVDVRILSASHKNLLQAVEAGDFRKDLYYRINVIEINVPPLKARLSDIPALAKHIIKRLCHAQQRKEVVLSEVCLQRLAAYDYPGNVRELENILERALAMCEDGRIEEEDIQVPEHSKAPMSAVQQDPVAEDTLDEILIEREREMILNALEKTKWNRTAAARLLGISFRTLRYRLKKFGIE